MVIPTGIDMVFVRAAAESTRPVSLCPQRRCIDISKVSLWKGNGGERLRKAETEAIEVAAAHCLADAKMPRHA